MKICANIIPVIVPAAISSPTFNNPSFLSTFHGGINMSNQLKCKVADIIDDYKLVLNVGTKHNVEKGFRFSIFSISESDIIDPDTNESLGKLETPLGTGKVIHVQEKICIIESDMYLKSTGKITKTTKPIGLLPMYDQEMVTKEIPNEKIHKPFDVVKIGDSAIYLPSFTK